MMEGFLLLRAPEPSLGILQELATGAGLVFRDQPAVGFGGLSVATAGTGDSAPEVIVDPTRLSWPPLDEPQEWASILKESLDRESLALSGYEACTRLHGVRDTQSRTSYSPWLRNTFIRTPVLNLLVKRFREGVQAAARQQGITLKEVPRWPDNKKYAIVLSHDVDWLSKYSLENARIFFRIACSNLGPGGNHLQVRRKVINLAKAAIQICGLFKRSLGGGADPLWNLEDWMELERRYNVRSVFYISPHSSKVDKISSYTVNSSFFFAGKRITLPEWVRGAVAQGWEIGLHGSLRTPASPECLDEEVKLVRSLSGQEDIGNRQHCLSYQPGATGEAHLRANLLYDSSLGFNEALGFRNSAALPFYPREGGLSGKGVLQVPMVIQDIALPAQGHSLPKALAAAGEIIQILKQSEGCGALSFHPGCRSQREWRFRFKVYQALLQELVKDDSVWITTARNLARWWTQRAALCRGSEEHGKHEVA